MNISKQRIDLTAAFENTERGVAIVKGFVSQLSEIEYQTHFINAKVLFEFLSATKGLNEKMLETHTCGFNSKRELYEFLVKHFDLTSTQTQIEVIKYYHLYWSQYLVIPATSGSKRIVDNKNKTLSRHDKDLLGLRSLFLFLSFAGYEVCFADILYIPVLKEAQDYFGESFKYFVRRCSSDGNETPAEVSKEMLEYASRFSTLSDFKKRQYEEYFSHNFGMVS